MPTSSLKYLLLLFLLLQPCAAQDAPLDTFNMVLGTQTFGPAYQFTGESKLVETARAIREMGSNIIKFTLSPDKALQPAPKDLAQVTRLDASVKAVLAMPFAHYLLWAYPRSTDNEKRRFQPESLADEYREMYDLSRALLRDYNRSGKTFYLGNWEGDWHLLRLNPEYTPKPGEIENLVAWATVRQKAVDDARRDTPHANVAVFYYVEVNRVLDAIEGKPRLANQVLARANPDFVSYSAYDAQGDIEADIQRALNYIESKLAPKPGLAGLEGRRAFIGEYGFPLEGRTPQDQDRLSRRVIRAGLEWGCRFVLYWEMFNNEVTKEGLQRGFWLIDDKNAKQPVYWTHQNFYERSGLWVAEFRRANGRTPSREEFGRASVAWLDEPAAQAESKALER